ncbi:fluoride efflux transporter FluC [Jeotgalibacillus marinus]|uniref:Fluoride-specific ion channel FluC n=1 Tax=Jeotgalibacillus marinus TaxID=86667 RepID=A0ABV3Q3R9_9BACL
MNLILVGFGGAIGAFLRAWLFIFVPITHPFPISTLLANLVGTFVLSFITFLFIHKYRRMKLFLGTGILGSFTSVSAFSVETIGLFGVNVLYASIYLVVTVVGGVLCAFLGAYFARSFSKEEGVA